MKWRIRTTTIGTVCAGVLLSCAPAFGSDDPVAAAVKRSDLPAVRLLIKQGAGVNGRDPEGATPLHWAVHRDRLDIVDALIRGGADVDAANEYGVAPLVLACENGSTAVVERLLLAGADPNTALLTGQTALMTAVRTGQVSPIRALLSRGADVNARERTAGQTALMWAAADGRADVLQVLLETAADVNARSTNGFTPLMFAARNGDTGAVRLLVDKGARVNEWARDGMTPLLIATVRGELEVARFLLDHGADPNVERAGHTALHWAVGAWETFLTGPTAGITAEDSEWFVFGGLQGSLKIDMVKLLLERGADPDKEVTKSPARYGMQGSRIDGRSAVGANAFWLAALSGDADVMRLLVSRGARTSVASRQKSTPLMMAAGLDFLQGVSRVREADALNAVKLVLALGADVNAANEFGDTAVHAAALWGATSIVQLLAESGADLNAKNALGQTPLMMARGEVRVSNSNTAYPETVALLMRLLDHEPGTTNHNRGQ